jgi:hypothetical protein
MKMRPKLCRGGVLVSVLAVILVLLPVTSAAPAQAAASLTSCRASSVRETLTTNAKSYAPGVSVVMRVSIRNVSSRSCSVAVGPTSPSMSIINKKNIEVWNNCYAGDQPGACAMFLALRILKPNAAYTLTKTWNQRTGSNQKFVARGRYVLTSNVSGVGSELKVDFTLAA